MGEVSDSTIAPDQDATRGRLSLSAKVALAAAVVVVLVVGAGGASAYSQHAARQDAIARQAAAARLTTAQTKLALAEDAAVKLESALNSLVATATGVADARPLGALTAAVVVLKVETDKPAFGKSAPLSALNDRAVDLDAAVAAALATVPAVGESVETVGTARLAAAGSASAGSASAARSALAALATYLAHHDDPRGVIIVAINAVKAAQASSDAAVAAAAAAKAAARSGGGSSGARPGAPVCTSDVLTCVNQFRVYYGLHALNRNASLTTTAQACADRMASSGQMTHSAKPAGWSNWGENIAEGYGSSVSVFNAWMASPGHRANILTSSYTQMGLGHVSAGGWWCLQFGA